MMSTSPRGLLALPSFLTLGVALVAFASACAPVDDSSSEEATELTEPLAVSAPYPVSWWNWNGQSGFYNIDSEIRVDVTSFSSNGYYYSTFFTYVGGGMGYMGLQQGAQRPDGTIGKLAIFSIWDSTSASGAHCADFGGEGVGKSCHIAYDWVEGHTYRLRTWLLSGNTWGAWVLDENTGAETMIGKIVAPSANGMLSGTANFTEHFAPDIGSCSELPYTYARYHRPTANNGTIGAVGQSSGLDHGSCGNYRYEYSGAEESVYHTIGSRSCGLLYPGQSLTTGEVLSSCDGRFHLVMQGDGNLVLYMDGGGALWASNTWGSSGHGTYMQGDGNLVLYNLGWQPLWASNSSNRPGALLAVQNDGNLVVYQDWQPVWASGTSGH